MKYNKRFLILFILIISNCSNKLLAQNKQIQGDFFSKLYFPFLFGYNSPIEKTLLSGSFTNTGIEYRFKKDYGFFMRFNFDSRNNLFKISNNNTTTNVLEGKINFNDYTLGVGYRIGNPKIRGYGIIQSGLSYYEYPTVVVRNVNGFAINDIINIGWIIKPALGLEYYIAPNAALVLEASYNNQINQDAFWKNHLHFWGITAGLTANLF